MSISEKSYRKILFLLLSLLLAAPAAGGPARTRNMPWEVGEKLTFAVRWGFITGGHAHMEVREKIKLDGRDTYRIVTQARSAPYFDPFYKVRDLVESYIDAQHLHSVRYEQDLNEGNFSRQLAIIYDHESGYAYENGERFEITENIQDVLSSFYFLRTKELEVGGRYTFDVGTSREVWPLEVTVEGRERIRVPAGRFDTLIVVPEIREEDGIFRKARGSLKIWVTDDERRIPVLMRCRIPIGSISAVLIEKELPGL